LDTLILHDDPLEDCLSGLVPITLPLAPGETAAASVARELRKELAKRALAITPIQD
jgi:hypothetical protein